ncbi:MAG: ribosome-recycling factor, partial [Negativicoccus succinicivorans]|nr:ribosome-recycling factor [Negativicoccus succinicivorans]
SQIRLNIPQLTEERRKELVKLVHKRTEEARVAVRNVRRDGNEQLKREEKKDGVSEDQVKVATDDVQKLTDKKMKEIDRLVEAKEKEVLEV